jgi:hypothetical protein
VFDDRRGPFLNAMSAVSLFGSMQSEPVPNRPDNKGIVYAPSKPARRTSSNMR